MIQEVLSQLETVQVTTADEVTVPLFARVWNNQVDYIKSGELQLFQTPAIFFELVIGDGGNIGQKSQAAGVDTQYGNFFVPY